ncbi:hypothetical protein D3C73_224290 [compost metagenome]
MSSRLQPLGYDGIGAMAGQPLRFCYRGRTGKDFCSRCFYPGKQLGRRQAEVEADYGGVELGQDGCMLGVERGATWPIRYSIGTHTELGIKRCQRLLPAVLFGRIRLTLSMAEEVDVEGAWATGRQLFQCLAQLGRAEHGRRQGSQGTRPRHRHGQLSVLHPGHGRLDDGVAHPQIGKQAHATPSPSATEAAI